MQPSKLLLSSLLATTVCAQQGNSLLFTTHANEVTRSGSNGTVLRNLLPRTIGVATPVPGFNFSAETFLPSIALQTMAGDVDANGSVLDVDLTGPIDAITVLPYDWDSDRGARPRTQPVTALDCYFSPSHDVDTNVSGAPGLRAGDCGRFVRNAAGNGQVSWFIRAEQLIAAFGMFNPTTGAALTPADIDLDAITVSVDRQIFVSFDGQHGMRLSLNGALANFLVDDGAVVALPAPAWTPNARGEVASVLANRGVIVFQEAQTNVLVANAMITDNAAACVPVIIDTESLAIDPNGGVFTTQWGNQQITWPHLLLNGELMSGAGVITTRNGGQIAQVNGSPLGRGCGAGPTTGIQMGLDATNAVSRLNALESLTKEPCWFVLGSPTPGGLGGAIEVHIGTNLGAAGAFLGFGLGALPVSPSVAFAAWSPNNLCFPELYPTIVANPFLPIALAAGFGNASFGTFSLAVSPVVAPGILFQAGAAAGGALHLSTPLTLN
jgi:hypothetical protein